MTFPLFRSTSIGISNPSGQCAQVPFPKMTGGIALLFEYFREGNLLVFEVSDVGRINPVSIGVTPG